MRRKPKQRSHDTPLEVWRFTATDPIGAHANAGPPYTIRDHYSSEGAALHRLHDFAEKRGSSVRTRTLRDPKTKAVSCMIHDCHFRWTDGRPGYATIMRARPAPDVVLSDDEPGTGRAA